MRGTDVTPEQLEAASVFLDNLWLRDRPEGHEIVSLRYEELVRAMAWYGALRADGALRGVGDTEHPTALFSVKP